MTAEELKEFLKKRDRIISVLAKDGKFRASIIKNTFSAQTAQQKHNLRGVPSYLLARQLAAASMMAIFLKGEERVILEADGSGPIQKVFAEASQVGEVRGFVDYDSKQLADFDAEKISDFFGDGFYKVTKVLYSKNEPVQGIVKLQEGDISSDLTFYHFQSEQIPTLVILDTNVDEAGRILYSSGLMVQAMPGVTDNEILSLYKSVSQVHSLNALLTLQDNLEIILSEILPFEFNVIKNDIVDFYCRCSMDSFKKKLLTLGLPEIRKMKDENHNELVCQYCNAHYYLESKDFIELEETLVAKQN
jgi:molecular chaperone Hsp33